MGMTDRFLAGLAEVVPFRSDPALSFDEWASYFTYNGVRYDIGAQTTYPGVGAEEISDGFAGLVQGAYKANGVVFACMLARQLLFAEARFQWREMRNGRPGDLFGTPALAILETPWPGGTTADLLTRMIQDADLGGAFYGARRVEYVKRMRPDWVSLIVGSEQDEKAAAYDLDAEILGFVYYPGGRYSGETPVLLLRNEVAYFAPIPDPTAAYRGMSWLTPIVREVMGDSAARDHKLQFFANGATPNMVVRRPDAPDLTKFKEWVKIIRDNHEGTRNAYRTLFLSAGAEATVVGSDLKQLDFKLTQGAGETRIAAAAGVPPVIVGLSEGLQAATYSNYGQARRRYADLTMRPLWRNAAGSLQTIVTTPARAALWYDDRDIPFLLEDKKDAAEVQGRQAQSIRQLIDAGFNPDAVVDAVTADDLERLVGQHTGLFSVQLQPPMPDGPPETTPPARALADILRPYLIPAETGANGKETT